MGDDYCRQRVAVAYLPATAVDQELVTHLNCLPPDPMLGLIGLFDVMMLTRQLPHMNIERMDGYCGIGTFTLTDEERNDRPLQETWLTSSTEPNRCGPQGWRSL